MAIGDIAFGIAAAFLAGVLAANLGWNIATFLGLLFVVGLALLLNFHLVRFWFFLLFFLFMTAIGVFYYHAYLQRKLANNLIPLGNSVSFAAIVSDEPKPSDKYLVFPAMPQPPFSGSVTVFAPAAAGFHYGDLLQIKGAVIGGKNPGEDPAVFPKTVSLLEEHRGFWLREQMLSFKAAILQKFREVLSPDEAALLGGVTFGGTDGMGKDLKNEMVLSGTSYITSMYGYKIWVVAWFIEDFLKFYIARRMRFLVKTALTILFVVMAGASIVVIRAALIAFLVLFAEEAGRTLSKRNALAVLAAGMVALDPTIAVQQGFTLSFLSVAGILYLGAPLKEFLGWVDKGSGILKWRESAIMAVAVLLAIIPVLVAGSGEPFSLSIFVSNALMGIAMPFVVLFGYALTLGGFLSHYLGVFIAEFAGLFLWFDFAVIRFFAVFIVPLPLRFDSAVSFFVYYLALGLFAYLYRDINVPHPA